MRVPLFLGSAKAACEKYYARALRAREVGARCAADYDGDWTYEKSIVPLFYLFFFFAGASQREVLCAARRHVIAVCFWICALATETARLVCC